MASRLSVELTGCDNVYIATGDSGQGMTHGTFAGILQQICCKDERNRLGRPVQSIANNPFERFRNSRRKH